MCVCARMCVVYILCRWGGSAIELEDEKKEEILWRRRRTLLTEVEGGSCLFRCVEGRQWFCVF